MAPCKRPAAAALGAEDSAVIKRPAALDTADSAVTKRPAALDTADSTIKGGTIVTTVCVGLGV